MTNDVTQNKVVILAGGWSDERDVSLSSAREVKTALQEAGFAHVDLLDIAEEGFVDHLRKGCYDVAFVALHGEYGEDGCVQGLLEILHIPYTFSGVLASSMAMEKDMAKCVYASVGLPVAQGITFKKGHTPTSEELKSCVEKLGLPLFVKPVGNGSSYGVTRVTESSELLQAILVAARTNGNVLVEACVEGREITVPVIGNSEARALPIIEIDTGAEFYDAKVKYEPAELHHRIPAPLPEDVYKLAQHYAVRAHEALGCRGCSRSDFIVRADGVPVILETNTIPGMTAASLLPDSARHAGIPFPELCKRFVELALED